MYSIDVENDRELIVVEVRGFWTAQTVEAFAQDLGNAVRRLGSVDRHTIVLGFDDAEIAPGPVIEALRHLVSNAPTHARRIALYTASALRRLQLKRIADVREGVRVFVTRDEALLWALAA